MGVVSLDLSAAFDVVYRPLLFERMKMIGIQPSILNIVKDWLNLRNGYVECNGKTSNIFELNYGTLQGSVLGPILFALFFRPIFELLDLFTFADDNYVVRDGANIQELKNNLTCDFENNKMVNG